MVVKADLTPAQSRELFWFIRKNLRKTDVGPLARALQILHDELEENLARE